MTTKATLARPADLDPTKLHSPAEVRAHRAEVEAYFAAVRAEADRLHRKEEAAKAEANKVLNDDEYYQLALEREAAKQAREAEREAERQTAADAKSI